MNYLIGAKRRSKRSSRRKRSRRLSKLSKIRSKCNKRLGRKSCTRRSKGKRKCSWIKRKSSGRLRRKGYCKRGGAKSYSWKGGLEEGYSIWKKHKNLFNRGAQDKLTEAILDSLTGTKKEEIDLIKGEDQGGDYFTYLIQLLNGMVRGREHDHDILKDNKSKILHFTERLINGFKVVKGEDFLNPLGHKHKNLIENMTLWQKQFNESTLSPTDESTLSPTDELKKDIINHIKFGQLSLLNAS